MLQKYINSTESFRERGDGIDGVLEITRVTVNQECYG